MALHVPEQVALRQRSGISSLLRKDRQGGVAVRFHQVDRFSQVRVRIDKCHITLWCQKKQNIHVSLL